MGYQIAARLDGTALEGFDVFAPDLDSAVEVALGVLRRHADMKVEVRDARGEIVTLDDSISTKG